MISQTGSQVTTMTTTDKYAVFGNPIKHSKSPQIHSAFAKQTQQQLSYRAHRVDEGKFADAARSFFDNGGRGLNITVPFKIDAFHFADELSGRARRAGAVNTLALQEDGRIYGDNTDGAGLVGDIVFNNKEALKDKRILVVGAGGAVRGILQPFLEQQPDSITLVNRTFEKAQALAENFKGYGNIKACRFEDLRQPFDVIINGTSASLNGQLPPIPECVVTKNTFVYDMMYAKEPTTFLKWAKQNGANKTVDGMGMLVGQAAVSFELWRQQKPDSETVLQGMRKKLQE